MDGILAERILGRPILCNRGWNELEALWSGRRKEIVKDYGTVHVELATKLEWDYLRVPVVPTDQPYHKPQMTGPYSWIDEEGYEVHCNPETGNQIMRCRFPEMDLHLGVDAIMTTDDYSDNRGPIMGVELFRKFVLPGIRRQSEAIHNLGGYFIKHTDGNLWDVLDDLVETGIDGWHGIQRNIGMDMGRLKKRYGEELCLFGGVNCETLINGSSKEMEWEVRTAIEEAAEGGGLVLTTSNVVAPGSKLETYLAMREAIRRYGTYARDS
jgi:hypothetical protein